MTEGHESAPAELVSLPQPVASDAASREAPSPAAGEVKGPAASDAMLAYFDSLRAQAMHAYAIAKQARRKGRDPTLEVEIPPAEDLAARVEAQVGPPGVAQRIREATARLGNREVVSLQVAQDVADDLSRAGQPREKALDQAVRTGLSILTEGVLVAPLEGIAEVKVGSNNDGSDYVDLYFAGPIRAAGGTAQAMSVLIADLVRRRLGIGSFRVTDAEVERYKEEIAAYKVEAHLQYNPSPAEIETIARNCPVCINGEGTEKEEVTGNRDLARVETNQLRGGACLVMAEGMILKAPKVMKHVEKLKLEGWDFLNEFLKKADKKGDESSIGADGIPEVPPNTKYVKEIIAGRPVFSHPSRVGGFRLRYGRARTAGLASNAFHPATMAALDDFLAVGTQLKVERPGKGTVATPCDTIEGPTVLLHNGSLVRIRSVDEARKLRPAVKEIVDVGEILIPFGEFTENNAALPRASWVWEWWVQEHAKVASDGPPESSMAYPPGTISGADMVRFAESTGVPLHPDGTLLWHDVNAAEMRDLGAWVLRHGYFDGALWLPNEPGPKETLVKLLALHQVDGARLSVEEPLAVPLLRCLGLDLGETDDDGGRPVVDTDRRRILFDPCPPEDIALSQRYPTVELASRLAGFKLMPRAPFRVGGRMGRPEKADARKMTPPPHGLFPLAGTGGLQRLVRDAAAAGTMQVEVGERRCQACGRKAWRTFCDCGGHTDPIARPPRQKGAAFQERETTGIDVRAELDRARASLQLDRLPETIKGVQGVGNADKVPEPLEKALLRARHGVYVFKDGTVRFDMTDVPLTHFRPREVQAPVARLVELGYTHDMHGAPLERDDQLLELRVQDIIVADSCGEYLVKTAKYMDDLLVRFYGLKPYYNVEKRRDLLGHLAIGLAPHTSGGVLCRIVGFTKAQCHFGHPYFHAAKRRNCLEPNTEVFVLNSPAPKRRSLEEIFETAGTPTLATGDGTVTRNLAATEVLAADPATGQLVPRRAKKILRFQAPEHLLKLTTKQGRTFTCSPGHRVETWVEGRMVKKKATALEVGDPVPAVGHLDFMTAPSEFDLLSAWKDEPGLVVRGLGNRLGGLIHKAGGRNAAADSMGISPKRLDNYIRRNSIPWSLLQRLASPSDIPADVRLGRLRDRVSIPIRLRLSPELMRLAGYYAAEGCARSDFVHQIDIAATESDIVEDILACSRSVFGTAPIPQPTRVTFSGKLVHDLFIRVLGLGRSASEKHIPPSISAAPTTLMAHFLSAYFSGDGSVEAGRIHVVCHSVSRGLLQDIALQLSRFRIASRFSTSVRTAGGAVAKFYERMGRPSKAFTAHRLSIRSTHAAEFAKSIGFTSARKQQTLLAAIPKLRKTRMKAHGDLVIDEIATIQHVPCEGNFLYDLEVEGHHNFVLSDLLVTSNCDGDEDAVLLLLDGLVNFSRKYVPDKRGGLMDLPLVLSTRLDPNEVDKETHNVDTLSRYPLAFYEATCRHVPAKDVTKMMGLVEGRIGTPAQYEGFGFTHDTADINAGPAMSSYKTLGTMMEKMTAQMELARKIRAVDEADVGARVIGTHFLPDLMGNLKAFSRQKVRCPKCNEKYRRMPLKGACLACGNTNLTLTVHEGSVRKYLEVSKAIATKYKIDAYTHQRILLLESAVESLFTNDKVKKAKLSDFF